MMHAAMSVSHARRLLTRHPGRAMHIIIEAEQSQSLDTVFCGHGSAG